MPQRLRVVVAVNGLAGFRRSDLDVRRFHVNTLIFADRVLMIVVEHMGGAA